VKKERGRELERIELKKDTLRKKRYKEEGWKGRDRNRRDREYGEKGWRFVGRYI